MAAETEIETLVAESTPRVGRATAPTAHGLQYAA